jgi:hypothetical protein
VSSYLLRKHYEKVILYADERTAKILSDSYYTEIRILPTDTLVKYGYGTLAKLYTYGNVEEEYIHFDIDYFLFNKIELENKILCSYLETKEKCGELAFETAYSSLINLMKRTIWVRHLNLCRLKTTMETMKLLLWTTIARILRLQSQKVLEPVLYMKNVLE